MLTRLSRRTLLQGSSGGRSRRQPAAIHERLSGSSPTPPSSACFTPLPPDSAPPGAAAKFSEDAFAQWKAAKGAEVEYEMLAWPQLHRPWHGDRVSATGSAPGTSSICAAGCPSRKSNIIPFADALPKALVDDLAEVELLDRDGGRQAPRRGVHASSPLTPFYNKAILDQAGFKAPLPRIGTSQRLRQGTDPATAITASCRTGMAIRPASAARPCYWMTASPAGRRQDVRRGRPGRCSRAMPAPMRCS